MKTITLDEYIETRGIDRDKLDGRADVLQQEVRAARLRDLRTAQELTQESLAEHMNVSQRRVSQIEHGQVDNTRLDTLRRYVEALGGSLHVEAHFGDTSYRIA